MFFFFGAITGFCIALLGRLMTLCHGPVFEIWSLGFVTGICLLVTARHYFEMIERRQ